MAAISHTKFLNAFFFYQKVRFGIKISLKFVPKGPIDNIGLDNGLAPKVNTC